MKQLREILSEMGFKQICNEWSATFEDDASGNIVETIVKDGEDENGIKVLEFHMFDEKGTFLGKYYLDQMIAARAMHFNLVPNKSNKKYKSTYHVEIAVPVDMSCVHKETFLGWFNEGCQDEESIAERIARKDLSDWLDRCPFEVQGVEPGETEEVINHV